MPAQVIDKGIPAPGLLAQVVVAMHDDHLAAARSVTATDSAPVAAAA